MRVIARRTLRGTNGVPVVVEIEEPFAVDEGAAYFCQVRVPGLASVNIPPAGGEDSLQALTNAIQAAGAYLYTCDEFKAGELKWLSDDGDLGLPRP